MGGGVSAHKEKIPRGNTPLIAAPNAPATPSGSAGGGSPNGSGASGATPQKASLGQRAARALRREKKKYPHDTHPGLIPGIAVDEQRVRYGTDPLVFGVAAVLILGFVAWGVFSTDSLKSVSDVALGWVVTNTGWLFSALIAVVLVFMLFVGFSRYGKETRPCPGCRT